MRRAFAHGCRRPIRVTAITFAVPRSTFFSRVRDPTNPHAVTLHTRRRFMRTCLATALTVLFAGAGMRNPDGEPGE